MVVLVVRLHVQDGLAAASAVAVIINAVCISSAITVDPSFFAGLYLNGNAQESMDHSGQILTIS